MARARDVFVIADGQARPVAADGKTPLRRLDGWLVSVGDWVASVLPAKQAEGIRTPVPAKSPFLRSSWNLTEQMRIQKQYPVLAAMLRAACLPGRAKGFCRASGLNFGSLKFAIKFAIKMHLMANSCQALHFIAPARK